MSSKLELDVSAKEADPTPIDGSGFLSSIDSLSQKTCVQTPPTLPVLPDLGSLALLSPAPAQSKQKVEVSSGAAEAGNGATAGEVETPILAPQVGGTCSIVHVLEWKEGMALVPSSNLKFCVSDCGTLGMISQGQLSSAEPTVAVPGKMPDPESRQISITDVVSPFTSVGVVALGQERPIQTDANAHGGTAGPGQRKSCDPMAQRTYPEQLRREPMIDKRVGGAEKIPGTRLASLDPDLLKPMKKRKRKDYLSPSEEESELDGMVGKDRMSLPNTHAFNF